MFVRRQLAFAVCSRQRSPTCALLNEGATVQTLCDLVAVPSVGGGDAESDLQHDLAGG